METTSPPSSEMPIWIIAILLAVAGVGLAFLRQDRAARHESAPLRTPTPNDAAPAWIGLGVMVMVYIYAPLAIRALVASTATPTSQPTTGPTTVQTAGPIDLGVAIGSMIATQLLGVLSAIAVHRWMRTPARRLLGLCIPSAAQWRSLVSASAAAISLTYLIAWLSQLGMQAAGWDHPDSHPMLQWMNELRSRPLLRVLAILSATLVAPIFEEVFFRGHLQTGLASLFRNKWTAVLVTSVIFASLHPWWTIAPIFFLSLCLGWIYERTGNLWLVMAMHVAFNATSTFVFLGSS